MIQQLLGFNRQTTTSRLTTSRKTPICRPMKNAKRSTTWEQDARQMMTASNEGMSGDEEGLDQRDTHRLGEVVRAKEKIGAKPKHKPSQ